MLILILLLLSGGLQAQSRSTALQQALTILPDRKLEINFVLATAIKNAASYRALESGILRAKALQASAEGPYDWTLFSEVGRIGNRADVSNPFAPSQQKTDVWQLGARKLFSTGTNVEAAYKNSFNSLRFPSPSILVPDYYNNAFKFSLSQNLWADAFGFSSRAESQSLQLRGEAQFLEYEENIETWVLSLIDQFYDAWLAQRRYLASMENLNRREKLLQNTRLKLRSGTAVRPDFLQVESAKALANTSASQAKAGLDHMWRSLVVNLKLPEAWITLPAEEIPMELNAVTAETDRLCASQPNPNDTLNVRKSKILHQAAIANERSARSQRNPRLSLLASIEANGVDGSSSLARQEVRRADHPSWEAMLRLEVPLGFSAQKGRWLEARANLIEADVAYQNAVDQKKIEIQRACDYFSRAKIELADARAALNQQMERIELEETRFRLGRATTTMVIQAGDDKTNIEQAKNEAEVRLRRQSWLVLRAASALSSHITMWKQ